MDDVAGEFGEQHPRPKEVPSQYQYRHIFHPCNLALICHKIDKICGEFLNTILRTGSW